MSDQWSRRAPRRGGWYWSRSVGEEESIPVLLEPEFEGRKCRVEGAWIAVHGCAREWWPARIPEVGEGARHERARAFKRAAPIANRRRAS